MESFTLLDKLLALKTSDRQAEFVNKGVPYLQKVCLDAERVKQMTVTLQKLQGIRAKLLSKDIMTMKEPQLQDHISLYSYYIVILKKIMVHTNWEKSDGPTIEFMAFKWNDSIKEYKSDESDHIGLEYVSVCYNLAIVCLRMININPNSYLKQHFKRVEKAAVLGYYAIQFAFDVALKHRFLAKDLNPKHLEIIRQIFCGIYYSNKYQQLKEKRFQHGLSTMGLIAFEAHRSFYSAYDRADELFRSSKNSDYSELRIPLLSVLYCESLYFDVISCESFSHDREVQFKEARTNRAGELSMSIGFLQKATRLLETSLSDSRVLALIMKNESRFKQIEDIRKTLDHRMNQLKEKSKTFDNYADVEQKQLVNPKNPNFVKHELSKKPPPEIVLDEAHPVHSLGTPFEKLMTQDCRSFQKSLQTAIDMRNILMKGKMNAFKGDLDKSFQTNRVNYLIKVIAGSVIQVPDVIVSLLNEIKMKGGSAKLTSDFKDLQTSSQHASGTIVELKNRIQAEEAEDSEMRLRFTRKWNRLPSNHYNGPYIDDINALKKAFESAKTIDSQIIETVSKVINELVECENNPNSIVNRVPKTKEDRLFKQKNVEIAQLNKKVNIIIAQISKTQAFIEQIKSAYANVNLESIAIKYFQKRNEFDYETILKQIIPEVEPMFSAFLGRIRELEAQLEAILVSSIGICNSVVITNDESSQKFEEFIGRLRDASNLYNRLKQASMFYLALNDRINQTKTNVVDFLTVRAIEKDNLIRFLSSSQSQLYMESFPSLYEMGANRNGMPEMTREQKAQLFGSTIFGLGFADNQIDISYMKQNHSTLYPSVIYPKP